MHLLDAPSRAVPRAAPARPRSALSAHPVVRAAVGLSIASALIAIGLAGGGYGVVPRQSAGLLLWWTVALASLLSVRFPRRPGAAGLAVIALVTGMAAWIALDPGAGASRPRSIEELERALTHLAPLVLVGWLLPRRYLADVFVGLLVGALIITAVALGSRLSPGLAGEAPVAALAASGNGRLAAPFDYWNAVGAWAGITALLLLATSAHAPHWWWRAAALAAVPVTTTVIYLTYSRSAWGGLLFGVIVLVALARNRWTVLVHALCAAALSAASMGAVRAAPEIANGTGGAGASGIMVRLLLVGLLACGIAAAGTALGLDRIRLRLAPARIVFAVGAVGAVLIGGVGLKQFGGDAWREFTTSPPALIAAQSDPSGRLMNLHGTRINLWRAVLKSWPDHRWTGTGAGTTEITINANTETGAFARDAHSAFIETLTEQGIVGLALLVGFLVAVAAATVAAIRRDLSTLDRGVVAGAAASVSAFVLGSTVDWLWETTAIALLAMGLVALIVSAGRHADNPDAPHLSAPERRKGAMALSSGTTKRRVLRRAPTLVPPWVSRTVLVAGALLAALSQVPGLVGTLEVKQSQQAAARGDLQAARANADTAIAAYPWASAPLIQRALVDEQQGQWRSARRGLRLAIQRDPNDWRPYLLLSRVEAKDDRPIQAIDAYRNAKRLRPRGGYFR